MKNYLSRITCFWLFQFCFSMAGFSQIFLSWLVFRLQPTQLKGNTIYNEAQCCVRDGSGNPPVILIAGDWNVQRDKTPN